LEGSDPSLGVVLTGSHCDAIPLAGGQLQYIIVEIIPLAGGQLQYIIVEIIPLAGGQLQYIIVEIQHKMQVSCRDTLGNYKAVLPVAPHAGMYDGTLGVIGAIEALAVLQKAVSGGSVMGVMHCRDHQPCRRQRVHACQDVWIAIS
jgi:hypothetical protein